MEGLRCTVSSFRFYEVDKNGGTQVHCQQFSFL